MVAIVDGNGPLTTTIQRLWPTTRIQRCHFHIRQAAHRYLTRRPVLPANKELLGLFKMLSKVTSIDEAARWMAAFTSWEAKWESFLKHRTQARPGTPRPAHVRPGQHWWYTHIRTRRAHKLLAGLIRDNHLFTWLELAEDGYTIAKTTNPLEGGPNKAIKDFLRAHRGLDIDHARRGVDWLLYLRTQAPRHPWSFVTPQAWTPSRSVSEGDQARHGPGRDEPSLRDGIQHRGWQRHPEGLGRQIPVRTSSRHAPAIHTFWPITHVSHTQTTIGGSNHSNRRLI
jgi:hypothetical protein